MIDGKTYIGDIINKRMLDCGISVEGLAVMSEFTVEKIEDRLAGDHDFTIKDLMEIADVLNCKLSVSFK